MRKQLFTLILILIFSSSNAFSQQKPFVFGFKVGPNFGWLKPDTKGYESTGLKSGLNWGFIADFVLMDNYSVATGFDVVFLHGGLEMDHRMVIDGDTTAPGILKRKYKLKYIQIPVTLKMRTNDINNYRFFGQIGLGSSFLIDAKADDEFSSGSLLVNEEKVDIYEDISFIRESLILGAGVEFSLGGSTNLIAALIYNNGFMDILKGKNTVEPTLNNKATSSFLSLEVGIVF
ncbi:MAG: porin family protein [Bacteroidota bacterium]